MGLIFLKETGNISKSQYAGTKKNTTCSRCGIELNKKTRLEQDQHEIECKQQKKLFE